MKRPKGHAEPTMPFAQGCALPALRLADTRASQLAEFAVTLPLLVVFAVGIFDFGSAFNLKQKLANAAREGARFASNQPTSDLSQPLPASVEAIANLVGGYLQRAKVNDCGLSNAATRTVGHAAGTLSWTYNASSGCATPVVLVVERGYTLPVITLPPPYASDFTIEATRIRLVYPYQWQFNRVIPLLVPGASYAGTTPITAVAAMENLN